MPRTASAVALSSWFGLAGRTALVTGASRGIGATTCRALDAAGARVVLVSRDRERLAATAASLTNDPIPVPADLGKPDGVASLLTTLPDQAPPVDILVNNAGTHVASATSPSDDEWDLVHTVNLRSAFQLARGLAPAMADRGWGRIINVASVLGIVADVQSAAYVSSKAGLIGLTRALAADLGPTGVTVNALCPGWIHTDMVEDLRQLPAFDRRVRLRTAIRRWGSTEDLAAAVVFLAGPGSSYMTGHALVIDGGLTARW
jgi:gluconate 5-dehydrogenase